VRHTAVVVLDKYTGIPTPPRIAGVVKKLGTCPKCGRQLGNPRVGEREVVVMEPRYRVIVYCSGCGFKLYEDSSKSGDQVLWGHVDNEGLQDAR